MTASLSQEEIRELSRDLRILVATNGTLTRILSLIADDDIVVEIVDQHMHAVAPEMHECRQLTSGRVLQRRVVLKGRHSGKPFVAAESLIAVDRLPATVTTALANTDHPLGEVLAASCLETFKEPTEVWTADLPAWLVVAGYPGSRPKTVARRYRIIAEGRPVLVVTEYFLDLFDAAGVEEV